MYGRGRGAQDRTATRVATMLAHPATTGAVMVLVVNDHLGKGRAPGWLTGRASDVAGVFLVAVLGSALIGRRTVALAATTLAFTAIKTSRTAAALAAPALGGITRRDPTDLLALASLVPAWFLAGPDVPARGRGLAAAGERGRERRRVGRAALTVTALGCTVFAVTATSCEAGRRVDALVAGADGAVYAHLQGGDTISDGWARSTDDGRTWHVAAAPDRPAAPVVEACASDDSDRCYRVVPGSRVEQRSASGAWEVAFAFTPDQLDRMRLRNASPCAGGADASDGFTAVLTAVGRESYTLVAMGPQGVLRRDERGSWTRRAVLELEPARIDGPTWFRTLYLAPVVLFLATLVVALYATLPPSAPPRLAGIFVSLAGAVGLTVVAGFVWIATAVDYTVGGPTIALLSIGVFVVSLVLSRPRRARPVP